MRGMFRGLFSKWNEKTNVRFKSFTETLVIHKNTFLLVGVNICG